MIYVIRSAEHCHLAGYDRLSEAGIEKRHFSFLSPRFVTFRFDSLGLMLGASSLRPRQRQNQKPRRGARKSLLGPGQDICEKIWFYQSLARAKIFARIEWKDTRYKQKRPQLSGSHTTRPGSATRVALGPEFPVSAGSVGFLRRRSPPRTDPISVLLSCVSQLTALLPWTMEGNFDPRL